MWGCRLDVHQVYCTWGDFHRDETWKPQIPRTWDAFDKAGHGIPGYPAIWRPLSRRDRETPCRAPILVVVFQPRISGCGTAVLFPFTNTWVHGLRLLQHSINSPASVLNNAAKITYHKFIFFNYSFNLSCRVVVLHWPAACTTQLHTWTANLSARISLPRRPNSARRCGP